MSEQELRIRRGCFTGHHPEKLKRTEEEIKNGLEKAILKAIHDGYTTFITGMARGVDYLGWEESTETPAKQPRPSPSCSTSVSGL